MAKSLKFSESGRGVQTPCNLLLATCLPTVSQYARQEHDRSYGLLHDALENVPFRYWQPRASNPGFFPHPCHSPVTTNRAPNLSVSERQCGGSDDDSAVPGPGYLRVRLRAPGPMDHGVRDAGQLPAVRCHRVGDHRVWAGPKAAELWHRLLPFQRPQYHHLLPELGPQAPVLRDHQAVRHAGAVQGFHVLRPPAPALQHPVRGRWPTTGRAGPSSFQPYLSPHITIPSPLLSYPDAFIVIPPMSVQYFTAKNGD